MEDFCRTCGKTVDAEICINIFSPMGRRLLHSVRTITNCWVENAAGFPIYICEECQILLKKINSFRKRCTKIEAFLTRRKSKLSSSNGISPAASDKAKSNDPLRIEEPDELGTTDIKVEPTTTTHLNRSGDDCGGIEPMSNSYYEDQPDSEGFDRLSFDEDLEEAPTDDAANADMVQKNSIAEVPCRKSKRNYTMRVGKRTMYIKLTDDQQPKRIVDRERQWASARPCICEHCGRQFKDGSNLNVHLLRHTGTKNYECTECNEKCYTLHLLRRHQLKHTEGPYECTFCGLQYSTKSSRVRHEREACKKGRGPQSKTELIKRGERTFHCDVCDLWFLRAGNLTQHMNSSNHIANARLKTKKFQSKQKKSLNMDTRDDGNTIL
ncbi:histone-lysine N-methyltransferase PRDM9 [Drosophila grimshawi]|uniref:GH18113 n=1 Tax=Drosophila grimshawi TaxID=7222 RepID=B4JGY4_DROGR|nr:histone-lysine N-methyltransferase PRDM9 [Drosophila grimshawi]EDV93762.1 GH18113 [Drosophila grimshawi]